MNDQLLTGLREAMELLQRGGPLAATGKIQETLLGLMPGGAWPTTGAPAADPARDTDPDQDALPPGATGLPDAAAFVPDLLARLGVEVPAALGVPGAPPGVAARSAGDEPAAAGSFLSGSYGNQAGSRAYRLYVPAARRDGEPLPLVVMLHGGNQGPDDCAAGTRLNRLAEDWPCLVLYPVQSQSANATLCWNWFNTADQRRDQGEPSIIAGMTREVMASHGVDPRRVYCAGMSAGGAMAVILGATYPDLYAAIGTHSGMPYGSASDFTSAFAAMNGNGTAAGGGPLQGVPVIAFHGDRDATVHPRNSDRILAQALPPATGATGSQAETRYGRAGTGHAYTRTIHTAPDGRVLAEQWLVHGAGHAWSGGSRVGTFTDASGPDASREMLRFFAALG